MREIQLGRRSSWPCWLAVRQNPPNLKYIIKFKAIKRTIFELKKITLDNINHCKSATLSCWTILYLTSVSQSRWWPHRSPSTWRYWPGTVRPATRRRTSPRPKSRQSQTCWGRHWVTITRIMLTRESGGCPSPSPTSWVSSRFRPQIIAEFLKYRIIAKIK